MATKCTSHPANEAEVWCEKCERKVCMDCSNHERHTTIRMKDMCKTFDDLCVESSYICDCNCNYMNALEKKAAERLTTVNAKVKFANGKVLSQLSDIRKNEVRIMEEMEKLKNGSDPIEIKYKKAKDLKYQSKFAQSKGLELVQSFYTLDMISEAVGRVEWVDEDQELVELYSFSTLKGQFIKSIRPVDSKSAWVLHYRDTAIYLMDYHGRILEKRDFGEEVIEDFCVAKDGEMIYTPWNTSELKKYTKNHKKISLFRFDSCYVTKGLSFKGEDVMVCLCSSTSKKPSKLAKMSITDETAKELPLDSLEKSAFRDPGRVSCTLGGIAAVVDWGRSGRFLKLVDRKGMIIWTWKGEMKTGTNICPFEPYDVSFCNINDEKRFFITLNSKDWSKVYSLETNGENVTCVFAGEKGFCNGAIAADPEGHLWIGDENGRIHIMGAIRSMR